jgi:hypothetical protein
MALTRPRSWQLLDSDFKESVRAATTGPVTLNAAPNSIDGVSLAKRDRILVKNQTNGAQNGIYYVQTLGTGSNGVWVRAPDFAFDGNVTSGVQVLIEEGNTNGDKVWQLITNNPIDLDVTALEWQVASGGGTLDSVTDGGNTTVNGITVGSLDTSGNVTASRLISNIATGTAPLQVTSTTQVANLNVATAGTVTTAAQPNITSLGNLTIANIDNIQINDNTISTLNANGNLVFAPNGTGQVTTNTVINATRFVSNIATGTAPFTVTSTTRVSNLNVANAGYADSAGTAGTVTTAAQPNITSVGTLASLATSGDVTIGGNLTINGVTTTVNSTTLDVDDLNITVAKGAANATVANGAGITVDGASATLLYLSASNTWAFDRGLGVSGTITGTQLISNVATGTAPFQVTSTTTVANLSVANATYATSAGTATSATSATTASTVTTAAQPNITSLGTLSALTVTGNVTVGNIIRSGGTSSQFLKADGSIDSTTYITSAAIGNGTLTLNTSGNGLSGSTTFTANQSGAGTFTVTSNATNANTANTIVYRDASGNFSAGTITATLSGSATSAGSATTAGTVTTAAQPNITSVGTLTSLGVSGNVTASRLISNIATGTAPLQVTSTTRVANLNVANAEYADTTANVTTTTDESTNASEYLTFVGASGANQVLNVAPNKLSFNPSTGTFSAVTKSFVIDHPSKSGMKLHYGCLESPYHGVRLTGEAKLEGNICKVQLPDYIKDLCKQEGSTVQLTNIKHGRTMWIDEINVNENYFTVGCEGYAIDSLRFYWSFTAVRKDVPDIEVEY